MLAEVVDRCRPAVNLRRPRPVGGRRTGRRVPVVKQLTAATLPAIVHWQFNHFVIVERWSTSGVDLVDPAVGRRRLTPAEFDAGFTGIVLLVQPGPEFSTRPEASASRWRHHAAALLEAPAVRSAVAQVLAAAVLLQVFGLAVPFLTRIVVDDVLPFHARDMLTVLGLGLGVLLAAQLVAGYLRTSLLLFLQARLDSHLTLGLFAHLLGLPFRFFQQRASGDLLTRLTSTAMIRETLTSQTLSVVLDGGLVVVALTALAVQDLAFALLVLAIGVGQLGLLLATTRPVREHTQASLTAQSASESYLIEVLSGVATLKAAGTEERALQHWSNLYTGQLNASVRSSQLSGSVETALAALRTFSPVVLLWVGAWQVLGGTSTLGTVLGLNALAISVLVPLSCVFASGQRLLLVGAYFERLTDILDAEPEQEPGRAAPPRLSGRIDLHRVSFKHAADGPFVLRDCRCPSRPGRRSPSSGEPGPAGPVSVQRLDS